MKNKQYITAEEYHNLFGSDDVDNAAGSELDDIFASGAPVAQKIIDTANPYIIILTSTSAGAISNVDFLYATESIWDQTTFGVTTGVTPTVGYANKTYKGFLSQLLQHEITFGAFMVETSTNAQATATLLFRTDNQRGKAVEDTVIPKILPNNQQTGIAYHVQEVKVSAWTKCTLSSLAAGLQYKLNMYPYKYVGISGTEIQYRQTGIQAAAKALK